MKAKILIIQLRQLGDILLTTPCIREIKRQHPESQVTFLCHKMGRQVLDGNPYVDEVFSYDPKEGFMAELGIMRALRLRHFDFVFDFMNNPRSALYSRFSRAHHRIAFQSIRRFAYNEVYKNELAGQSYIVQEKFQLLEKAGFNPKNIKLDMPWFEPHAGPALKYFHENDVFKNASMRVILSPTHRRERRQWPEKRFAELADYLVARWGAAVTWVWGPGEEDFVNNIISMCQEKTTFAPSTTLRELTALIANHDLFIGTSNGPSHLAVAADICTLQLHGHTNGISWCPGTDRHRYIQSPEQRSNPEHAMDSISVDEVISNLEQFRPELDLFCECQRKKGVRLTWRQ